MKTQDYLVEEKKPTNTNSIALRKMQIAKLKYLQEKKRKDWRII